MEGIPFHPLANIFPMITGKEFDDLVADVRAHGVREPVVLYEGMILDGRNRFSASQIAGLEPTFIEYQGDDPAAYVISLNLHRRHLNESQRAMVAAKLADMPNHRPADKGANLHTSAAEAGAKLNVSERTVKTAKKVQATGTPELQQSVESGAVSVSAAADIATLPPEQQTEVVAKGEREILQKAKEIRAEKTRLKRAERITKIAEISQGNAELPQDKVYPVIYADPPWRYEHSETASRDIENQYPTMALDDICALPVPAADDAIIFLWTTAPKLEEGLRVLREWGFSYRSCAVWDKQKIGMGYYFRVQHEILLIGTRGSIPTPLPENRPRSVISIPYDGHSVKPSEVAGMIEAMYPELPKLEMFCRSRRDGWDAWGNQSNAA